MNSLKILIRCKRTGREQTDDELLHDISSGIAQSGEQLFTDLVPSSVEGVLVEQERKKMFVEVHPVSAKNSAHLKHV